MSTDSLPYSSFPNTTPDLSRESGLAGTEARVADRQQDGSDVATAQDSGRGEMVDRVVRTAHATIDRLADTAAPHINRLSQSLTEAGERVQGGAGDLQGVSAEWADSLRSTVRDHPLAALGAAVAVGLLVARLTR